MYIITVIFVVMSLVLLVFFFFVVFFFKQKTAYEMRISDWSSDVCSSDLDRAFHHEALRLGIGVCDEHRLRHGVALAVRGEAGLDIGLGVNLPVSLDRKSVV